MYAYLESREGSWEAAAPEIPVSRGGSPRDLQARGLQTRAKLTQSEHRSSRLTSGAACVEASEPLRSDGYGRVEERCT